MNKNNKLTEQVYDDDVYGYISRKLDTLKSGIAYIPTELENTFENLKSATNEEQRQFVNEFEDTARQYLLGAKSSSYSQ